MKAALSIFFALWMSIVCAQRQPDNLPVRPTPILMGGPFVSTSASTWFNLRLGLETKRQAFLVGVHRYTRLKIVIPSLYVNRMIVPWPVGVDLWFRHYLAKEKAKLSPFFFVSLSISRSDVEENPRYYANPKRLGAYMYFEPALGYGLSWSFSEWFSLGIEAGAGLDIGQYFPKGQKPDPAYWPGGFMGAIMLEKRF